MEALILNSKYETIDILDIFESFIWTVRYYGHGDFELYLPVNTEALDSLKIGNYIMLHNSDRYMIVETLETDTNVEEGSHLTVTGRSLESILDRRIIWGQTVLSGNFQVEIERLLKENVINPVNADRKIPKFAFKASTDSRITSLEIETQFFGENLYEAIHEMCLEKKIGFRVLPEGEGGFIFELYAGLDHSYDQEERPYVVFSPKFDNLLSSNYFESLEGLKTAALAAGEGEGAERKTIEVGSGSGLSRREMFVDVGNISSDTEERELTEEEYNEQMTSRGLDALAGTSVTKLYEGELEPRIQFIYGEDFLIGDIVQVSNEYGMESKSRIIELVISHSTEGESMFPTFSSVEES